MAYARYEKPLQDAFGNLLAGQVRQIEIRRESTGTLARLYSDRDGTAPLANPLPVTDGKLAFHVVGGAYRIIPVGYESDELRYVGIGTASEQDGNTFNSQGWQYQVETETTAPPTAGCVRFNNADLSLVTEIYVSSESLNGSDAESNVLGLDPGSKTVKNRVAFADQGTGVVMSYDVDSATDGGDYVTLAVSDHDGSTTYSGAALFLQREMAGRNGFDQDDARNFETATEAALYNPASAPAFTRTAGYVAAGDGGAALYKLVVAEPSHVGKYQDAAGNWYELADRRPNAAMFGNNLANAFAYIAAVGGALRVPAGTYTITAGSLSISGATVPFRIYGDGRESTKIVRGSTAVGSLISIASSDRWAIEDLSLDGGFSGFASNANHGLVFNDCSHVRVRRVHVTNWKNSAIIGYVTSPTTDPAYEDCVIDDCSCEGGSAANNGLIIVDMKRSGIRNSNSLNVGKAGSPCYALQVKNGAQDGFIENCYAENASAGVAFGNNDVVNSLGLRGRLMGLNILNCSVGITLGSNNYIVGSNINIDMNSAGDYGLDFGGSTVGCVFDALRIRRVASGKAAVRFRSGDNENVVRLGVASRAAGSAALIEFLSGAQNNYARIDHVASVTDSSTLVSDAGTGNVFEYSQLPSRQSITIASDAISLRDAKVQDVRLDTESAAATDNLATINNGVDGQQITLSTSSNLRDVTVKHNTGNILLNGAADFTLDAAADTLTLRYSGNLTKWCEVGRGNNT